MGKMEEMEKMLNSLLMLGSKKRYLLDSMPEFYDCNYITDKLAENKKDIEKLKKVILDKFEELQ